MANKKKKKKGVELEKVITLITLILNLILALITLIEKLVD